MTQKLEEAKKLYQTANADQKYVLESLFPELKESEDEKIRKELIKGISKTRPNTPFLDTNITREEAIDWLEKQGEKEYALKSSKDEDVHKFVQCIEKQAKAYELNLPNRSYDIYGFAKDILAWLEKQGEQKSAWNEEDNTVLNNLIYALANDRIGNNRDEYIDWLKSLKERVQPKQEWSEEDEKMLNQIIKDYERSNESWLKGQGSLPFGNRITWLKSLRPQNTWKPSDEQMEALKGVQEGVFRLGILKSLYQDLKKLKEE